MGALPPIALEVIALADEVRAHLARGELAGRTVAQLGTRGTRYEAEFAARLVLADVEYWLGETGRGGRSPEVEEWRELATQLRAIERVAATRRGI